MKPSAKWTDDCQGKKDFDGEILSVSTRYWPGSVEQEKLAQEGLGFNLIDANGQLGTHAYEQYGRPSAHSSILLMHGEPANQESVVWREKEFVADTPEEVKQLVEEWIQQQFDEVCSLLGIKESEGGINQNEIPPSKV